jgi:hypothetical protein
MPSKEKKKPIKKKKVQEKNKTITNKRGDKEPVWFFGTFGTILSIIFLPVFIIAFVIYLAQWMCYNLDLPMPVCYILALVSGPLFLPFFLISVLVKAVRG